MTHPTEDKQGGLEEAARTHCANLLTSSAARALPKSMAEALVIIAFTYGAAWALDRPDMIALGDAHLDSMRSNQQ